LDWFEIDKDHVVFYFADVSGHGPPSSFLTVFLKNLIDRTRDEYTDGRSQLILNPAKVLFYVNGEILKQHFEKHVTLFYGIIDKRERSLSYTNGGQYPFPVFSSAAGDVFTLDEGAHPPGLFGFADYFNNTITLPEEFTLTIASDGLLELMDGKNIFDRETAFIELCRKGEISDSTLCKRLDLYKKGALPDDVTLLIITKDS
jgi:serine phosphatase RsbU (regulator of sigma subunit)